MGNIFILNASENSISGLLIMLFLGFIFLVITLFVTIYLINKIAPKNKNDEED